MPNAKSKAKSLTKPMPWWLSAGDEECPHCGQLYVLEVEFRCPDCDGPSCPHCKKRHAEERDVCPECVEPVLEGHVHGR